MILSRTHGHKMRILKKLILPLSLALILNACAGNPKQQNNAEFYLTEAKAHLAAGDRVSAIKSLNQAILLNPDKADYYARRGHLYAELNEISIATQDIDQALKLDQNHTAASFDYAQLLIAQGRHAEALNAINHTIQLTPNNPRYLGARCVILVASNSDIDGLKDCNTALTIKNGESIAYTSRGQAYLLLNRNIEAHADFKAALKISPNNMRALYGRGLARQKQGDIKGGAKDIALAISRLPGAGREFTTYVRNS